MLYEKLTDVEQGWSQENKCNSVCTHLCSVAKSCLTLCNLWTVAHQAPLSMGFPKQEYWSGLPFPSPGDPPDPGIEPLSPASAGGFFTTELSRKSSTQSRCVHMFVYLIYCKRSFIRWVLFFPCYSQGS